MFEGGHDQQTRPIDRRRRVVATCGALVVAGMVALGACNDDGRELRPARPDQNASVSTIPPPTDPVTVPGEPTGIGTATPTVAPGSGGMVTLPGEAVLPTLTASWRDGGPIDARHTCDGDNVSPALSWSPAPAGTVEIALSLVDLDAPGYGHWVLAGLDPLDTSLGEGVTPELAIEATNSTGVLGYTGPCPPPGTPHTYLFRVHYLGQQTELADGAAALDLLAFVEGAAIAVGEVTGTYSRT